MHNDALRLAGFVTDKALVGPKRLSIKVINWCNYACFYCGCHSQLIKAKKPFEKFSMDFDVFKKVVHDAKALKVDEIVLLASGEPFLHERIYDMIDMIKQNGFRLAVLTNGTFDKKKIRTVSQVDYFIINFNSFREDVFLKTQYGRPQDHYAVLENLRILSKLKRLQGFPNARLLFLVHTLNVDEIRDVFYWVKQHDFDYLEFRLPFIKPEMKDFILDPSGMQKMRSVFKELMDQDDPFLQRTNIKFFYENFSNADIQYLGGCGEEVIYYKQKFDDGFQCPAAWYYATIDIDGNIYACCHYRNEFRGGNIYQDSLRDIWHGKAFADARKAMKYSFDIHDPFWQKCHNCCDLRDLNLIVQKAKKFSQSR